MTTAPQATPPSETIKPLDALLAAYCSGGLDLATHSLVASHLLLSRRNRRFVAALEDLAASELEHIVPAEILDRDRKLANIFASNTAERAPAAASVLPAPLLRLVGADIGDLKWRNKLPGVREYRVSHSDRGEAVLLWVGAGRRMPSHTHDGSEVTLVLKGAFSDITGRYMRGDLAIAEADLDHRPRTDDEMDCLCFAVTDAPLRLTGPVGRILDRFFGQPH